MLKHLGAYHKRVVNASADDDFGAVEADVEMIEDEVDVCVEIEPEVEAIVLQLSVRQLHQDYMRGRDSTNSCLCKAFHYLAEM